MLIMICSCGEILGNKQIPYEEGMQEICKSMGYDYNIFSIGYIDKNEEFITARQELVKKLVRRPCCSQALMNYIDIVQLIK